MKHLFKAFVFTLISLSSMNYATAQHVREANITFNKNNYNGVIADYNYSKDLVSKALENKIKSYNLGKAKSVNKFNSHIGVNWTEITGDKVDIYYRVSGKKNNATIEFLISKGYDNYINSTNDPYTISNLRTFLTQLEKDIAQLQHNNNITDQQELVKKAEKELKNAQSNVTKAEKELDNANKKLEERQRVLNDAIQKLNSMK